MLSTNEVKVNVVHAGVGGIKESDVMLAAASNGLIVGFGVRPDTNARQVADREGVEIRTYKVIYEMVEECIESYRLGRIRSWNLIGAMETELRYEELARLLFGEPRPILNNTIQPQSLARCVDAAAELGDPLLLSRAAERHYSGAAVEVVGVLDHQQLTGRPEAAVRPQGGRDPVRLDLATGTVTRDPPPDPVKPTDVDEDGILDVDDACPNDPGPPENNGCPDPDRDGDGVLDRDDRCPSRAAGPIPDPRRRGCPRP